MDLKRDSNIPVYKQIAEQLTEKILTGQLNADDRILSIRELAKELNVSVITVSKAYEKLSEQGLIVSSKGKGYFVNTDVRKEMIVEKYAHQADEHLANAITSARMAGYTLNDLQKALAISWGEND